MPLFTSVSLRFTSRRRHSLVQVQHESLASFTQNLGALCLCIGHEGHGVDDTIRQADPVLLEPGNLILDVILEETAVLLPVPRLELPELLLKDVLVEELGQADAVAGGLGAVAGTDAALRRADGLGAQNGLLKTVDGSEEIKVDVAPVGDIDALASILEAFGFEFSELLEEGGLFAS